jgi:hypothetical protein
LPNSTAARTTHAFEQIVDRDVVEPEEVAVLGDHLARQLHGGLLLAPDAKEYAQ